MDNELQDEKTQKQISTEDINTSTEHSVSWVM